jgi:two-component system OmpR family response regulator
MKKILVVEDDVEYRELLKNGLEAGGYDVTTTADGESALHMLEHMDMDLIILDLMLPKMDGIGFLYHLKNDLKKDVPTIILTNLERSAYPAGVRDFLIKSDITVDELALKVKEHLGS